MKDFFTQIGIGIVMSVLFVVTIIVIGLVWVSVLLYSAFQWLVTNDGYTHNKCKCGCKNHTELYKPLDPKLEQEFDVAFSKKPFPKPYSPTDNPLYKISLEDIQTKWMERNPEFVNWLENQGCEFTDIKKPTIPFDREKVFKMVDESNVRMSQSGRHNIRGEKGRFIKRSQVETPITRYGVPTSERFGKQ